MISIVMPSLNPDLDKICCTLDNILQNKGEYEVVLVLQATDIDKRNRILKLYQSDHRVKVINDTGIGISRARNIAIQASLGEWILLLDDDITIARDTIQKLDKKLSSREMLYYGNAFVHGTDTHYVRYYIVDKNLNIWSYNRVSSISLIISRRAFNKLGLFDEDLGSGCKFGSSEESDFIIRALLENIRIGYLEEYVVYHDKAKHSLKKIKSYAMGGGALCRKHMVSGGYRLSIKFLFDLVLRIFFLLSFQKKRYIFLKGFFKGFSEYGARK